MPRGKIGLQFDGWEDYMAKLDEIGGSAAMKKGVDKALIASKEYATANIEKAMTKLPAKGKYSTGRTKESIIKDKQVSWSALTGSTDIGFDFGKSGLTSIFLMYGTKINGTPRMKPVSGLKAAIYGAKTKKEIAQIQSEEIGKVIRQIMEG